MYTSISPVERRYALLKAQTSNYIADKKKPVEHVYRLLLHMRLFASTPCSRVNDAGARLLHPVGCLYVRAGATVCGCLCGCCDRSGCPPVRSVRLSPCLLSGAPAASGQRVSTGNGRAYPTKGTPGQGGFVSVPSALVPSVHALPSAPLRLFKSRQGESREPESRKV